MSLCAHRDFAARPGALASGVPQRRRRNQQRLPIEVPGDLQWSRAPVAQIATI
jgi:hypothetical protein